MDGEANCRNYIYSHYYRERWPQHNTSEKKQKKKKDLEFCHVLQKSMLKSENETFVSTCRLRPTHIAPAITMAFLQIASVGGRRLSIPIIPKEKLAKTPSKGQMFSLFSFFG